MRIVIEFDIKYTDSFIKWLLYVIKNSLIANIDDKRLVFMSEYLSEQYENTRIDLCEAFVEILNSIYYFKSKSCYHIGINPLKRLRRTKLKLIDLAKFINYGNLEVQGTYVFSKVFNDITTNLDYYYGIYLMEEGVL